MNNALELAILDTVSYFDIFDYPLTHFEIFTFLYSEQKKEHSFSEVQNCLEKNDELNRKLHFKDGYVGMKGRESLTTERQRRYILSHAKFRKVRRFARLARHLPFVELIAACNNLSFFNAKKESDLDFFIIAKKGKVSVVRFFAVLISIIFFKRPSSTHHEDAICLSFFVDSAHQRVTDLSLPKRDIYMQYWYATLQPLFLKHKKTYETMEEENNEVLSFYPNHYSRVSTSLTQTGVSRARLFAESIWKMFHLNFLASWLYSFQIKRLPREIATIMNTSTSVVVTSSIFKTHSKDIREKIYDLWNQKKGS